ncbi:hypothetical protein GCM10027093_33670 [Paraburkholderia jirisanensis]
MKIETHSPMPEPSLADITALEKTIGARLPTDYLNFLQTQNGVIFTSNEFDIPGGNHAGINQFIPFEKLLYEKSLIEQTGNFGFLPIAYAEGGNYVCLATRKLDIGEIYFCDHEIPGEEAYSRLASSLSEFFDLIRPFSVDDIEIDKNKVKKIWINPEFLKRIKGED